MQQIEHVRSSCRRLYAVKSDRDMAAAAGVDEATYGRFRRGKSVSAEAFLRIALVVGFELVERDQE